MESMISETGNMEGSYVQRNKEYVHRDIKSDKRTFKQSIDEAIQLIRTS